MAGMFNFFKKKPEDGDVTSSAVVTQSQTSVQSTGGSYSGIGNPPTGKSYSGIGNPPSGQAYSGIGQPTQSVTAQNVSSPSTPPTTPTTASTPPQQTVVQDAAPTDATPSATPPAPTADTPASETPAPTATQATTATDTPSTTPADKSVDQKTKGEAAPIEPTETLESKMDTSKRTELDLMTHLTHRSNTVFVEARNKATELKNEFVDTEHLLHGLMTDSEIYKLLTDVKILPQVVEDELTKVYKKDTSEKEVQPSPRVKKILNDSLVTARKLGFDFISPEHILLALYDEGEGAGARVLAKLGLNKEDLRKKILGKKEAAKEGVDDQKDKRSILDQYTIDLTAKAAEGLLDPVVERSEVIERLIHILSRRTKNNPALVGEAGVGKTAVVEGLAQKIVTKQVPESLMDKQVRQLDLMSLIAGASHRGEFEERMKGLIEEIVSSKGKIILFIDEIHNLVGAGAGGEGALDASNFLKPALARGELQVVGATTLTEYRKYIEKDPALERRFQTVLVPEPTAEQAIKMLKSLRDKYEGFHRVKIPDEAIEAAVKLSKRYVGERFLPDKAVDLIDEAAAAVRLPMISLPEEIQSLEERHSQLAQEMQEAKSTGGRVRANIMQPKVERIEEELRVKREEYESKKSQTTTAINSEIIKDIVSRWTGIPVSKISDSELEKLTKLEDIMHLRLINQESAVASVAQAVRRGRAGLKSNKRPIGSFVFLGPTGVGKTELAKTLAEILFGQEEAMIRLDMTEYMEKHEVAKLLGAPPGYVGYEEGGKLTEAVRRKPYSVVLFDEVEKAHPDIFNILLQILDDGRLTDNKGHTISFKNTVVICTSNIGTSLIQDEILKSGKVEIEEPPVLSTYTFSPRGREILTMMGKMFQKDPVANMGNASWISSSLLDYFAGQKIESDDEKEDTTEFPIQGFDSQAMSPKGVEYISLNDRMFVRTSTTNKIWKLMGLIDYFKEQVVINALPDAPEQQLPTTRLKTHAFSPDEYETVTYKDRFWRRKSSTNNWETGLLKDYFKDQTIAATKADADTQETPETVEKKVTTTAPSFPINYWDIQSFSPEGRETIIVGHDMWVREQGQTNWTTIALKDYFGADFPLEKELEEKKKIESEVDKNRYHNMKSKVMGELRKFFRPELINRFDEVIIFEPLRYEHMYQIAELQLKSVKLLLEEQNMGFAWTETANKEIVRQGFDPIYGARPLKRTIQKLVENPISTLIIQQKFNEGDLVLVDFDGENFVFNIEKVELVSASEMASTGVKHYFCESCGNSFDTDVIENATVICSKCASKNVQLSIDEKKPEISTPDASATPAEAKSTDSSISTPAAKSTTPDGTPASETPSQDNPTPPAQKNPTENDVQTTASEGGLINPISQTPTNNTPLPNSDTTTGTNDAQPKPPIASAGFATQ